MLGQEGSPCQGQQFTHYVATRNTPPGQIHILEEIELGGLACRYFEILQTGTALGHRPEPGAELAGSGKRGKQVGLVLLTVEGADGFKMTGSSSISQISRDPADIAGQTLNAHHHYPDGFVLFLGTMFAPSDDRDVPGRGFTHKTGDIVTIATAELGALVNRVVPTDKAAPWTYGTADLMRNLAKRGLLHS